MSSTIYDLFFRADSSELDQARDSLRGVSDAVPGASGAIDALSGVFDALKNPVTAAVTALAAMAAGAMALGFKAIDAADQLDELAAATGRSVENLQVLGYVAQRGGIDLNSLLGVYDKVAKGMAKGDDETVKFNKAMAYFGLTTRIANGELNTSEKIAQAVAERYSKMEDTTSRSAAASEALGKGYRAQIPALLELSKAQEYKNMLSETGAMVDDKLAAASAAYNDSLDDLGLSFKGLGNEVARVMLPALTGLTAALISSATNGGILEGVFIGLKYVVGLLLVPIKVIVTAFIAIDTAVQIVSRSIRGLVEQFSTLGQVRINFDMEALKKGNFGDVLKVTGLEAAKDIGKAVQSDVMKSIKLGAQLTSDLWKFQVDKGNNPGEKKERDPNGGMTTTNTKDKKEKDVALAQEELTQQQKAVIAGAKMLDQLIVMSKVTEDRSERSRTAAALETAQYQGLDEEFKKYLISQAAIIDGIKLRETVTGKLIDLQEQSSDQLDYLNEEIRNQGLSANEIRRKNEELRLELNYKRALAALDKGAPGYDEQVGRLTSQKDQDVKNLNSKLDEIEARGTDGWKGMQDGMTEYFKNTATNYDMMKGLASGTFANMSDALGTFVTTGKLNFKDFAASLLGDLAQVLARMAMMNAMKAVFGFADGGAFSGGVQFFAKGGVVDGATPFGMSNGNMGVMGEAGPEAIMPLSRGADGKLGVRVNGAGSGSSASTFVSAPNINVTIGSVDSDQRANEVAQEMARTVQAITRQEIAQQMRSGNMLFRG